MIIENIAYINLDNRIDKKIFILDQLKNAPKNIEIQRIPGITASPSDISYDILDKSFFNKKITEKELCGIIGVNNAHRNAIKSIIDTKSIQNFSLIIEDDISIDKNFWSYIYSIQPNENTDIIFFDIMRIQQVRHRDKSSIKTGCSPFSSELFKRRQYGGAFCYAIRNKKSKQILDIILKKSKQKIKHYDQMLFRIKKISKEVCICNMIDVNFSFGSDRIGILSEQGLIDANIIE